MKNPRLDLALFVLRLVLATVMLAHGSQKLFGWFGGPGVQGFLGWTGSMGIPPFLGWLAIIVETFGGLGVLLGLLSRLAALGFAVNMIVAIATVHLKEGFFGAGVEFPLSLLAMALTVVLVGPGRFAIAPHLDARLFGDRGAA
jgi:putative oxidoreductase